MMDTASLLRQFMRRWLTWGLALIIGVGLAAGYCAVSTTLYASEATILLSARAPASGGDLQLSGSFVLDHTATFVDLANTSKVLTPVLAKLGPSYSLESLRKRILVESPAKTALISIKAEDPDPAVAAEIAGQVAESLRSAIESSSSAEGSTGSMIRADLVDPAVPSLQPSQPLWGTLLSLGAVAGLSIGLAITAAQIAWAGGGQRSASDGERDSEPGD